MTNEEYREAICRLVRKTEDSSILRKIYLMIVVILGESA